MPTVMYVADVQPFFEIAVQGVLVLALVRWLGRLFRA